MRRRFALVLALALAAATAAPALAADVNLNWYPFAARSLDQDFWDPIEDQYGGGVTVDMGAPGSPLHFAVGLHGSVGTEDFNNPLLINDATGVISELSFGIAKVWETKGSTRPFLSGGLSFVRAEVEADTVLGDVDDNDDSIGVWVEGGVYWRLSPHFNLGLFGRLLAGSNITLFDEDGDADYWEVGPMLGWSWPAKK